MRLKWEKNTIKLIEAISSVLTTFKKSLSAVSGFDKIWIISSDEVLLINVVIEFHMMSNQIPYSRE